MTNFDDLEVVLTEREQRASDIIQSIAKALRRTARVPRGPRLERFCDYFERFDQSRIDAFIGRVGKTAIAMDKDFKFDDIVTKDWINRVSIGKANRAEIQAKDFYDIQVLEV